MTRKYEVQRQYAESHTEIQAAIRYALRRVSKRNVNQADGKITFQVPMSCTSWGEKMTIVLENNGNVKVSSVSTINLHDWGKNKSNVETVLDWMDEYCEIKMSKK